LSQRRLVCEAWLHLAWARWAVGRWPWSSISRSRLRGTAGARVSPEQIAEAIETARDYTWWDCRCLVRALAGREMLGRRGISSTLRLGGNRPSSDDFGAHAWLTCGSFFVVGGDVASRYRQVVCYSDEPEGTPMPVPPAVCEPRLTPRARFWNRFLTLAARWDSWEIGPRRCGPFEQAHEKAVGMRFRHRGALERRVLNLALAWSWPARAAIGVVLGLARWGSQASKASGLSKAQLGWDSLKFALGKQIPVNEYYQLELFRPSLRPELYFHQLEQVVLQPQSQEFGRQVDDKLLFDSLMREIGLPQAALFGELPPRDLMAKTRTGAAGRGMLRLFFRDGLWWLPSGQSVNQEQLQKRLLATGQEYLIQEKLEPNPTLLDIAAEAVPVVRILSGYRPDWRQPLLLQAQLSLPRAGQWLSQYGLWCPVDLESGRLGRARLRSVGSPSFESHPDFQGAIAGRLLADWAESCQMVIAAHRRLPEHRALGWDVALSDRGPIILEANRGWETALPQRLSGPLGTADLLALLAD
jgi:hypothetical protein